MRDSQARYSGSGTEPASSTPFVTHTAWAYWSGAIAASVSTSVGTVSERGRYRARSSVTAKTKSTAAVSCQGNHPRRNSQGSRR